MSGHAEPSPDGEKLRKGWTTGACATAASAAAYQALLTGAFPDPVTIALPGGRRVPFAVAVKELRDGSATAGVVKDAGDDPDVTHGALVLARVTPGPPGSGVAFAAGPGVGTVTLPGLPVPVGEPAINPVPRRMMRDAVTTVAAAVRGGDAGGRPPDLVLEIGVENGEEIARQTWNPRLGIVGGLSILGTTGVVIPYSCSAWIASIHRGVDVARATGLRHAIAATGSTSEAAALARFGLPETAALDMGDFAGALLTYVARHPIERLTIAGGFAKLSKLAAGALDLHSARSQVDFELLARHARELGGGDALAGAVREANSAMHALELCTAEGVPLAARIAEGARATAAQALSDAPVSVDVLVVDRSGEIVAEAPVSTVAFS